ncbi:MAG: hypothetical protein PHY59_06455 [Methanobacterium sp.]|nr:hypothetical protein [Methanobacterium sp.]
MVDDSCDIPKKKKITKNNKFHDSSNPELIDEPISFHSERIDKNKGKKLDPLAHKSGPSDSNKIATPRTPGVTKKKHPRS